jgi:hypothetical protein
MNPLEAQSIEEARRMQYEVFLDQAYHNLLLVRAGLEHCEAMADVHGYKKTGLSATLYYLDRCFEAMEQAAVDHHE